MKRLIIYSILSIVAIYSYGQNSFNKTDIKSIMKSVADWQIANPASVVINPANILLFFSFSALSP